MTDTTSLTLKIKESSGIRLAVLFGTFFICLIFVSIITQFLGGYSDLSKRTVLLTGAFIQCLLVFILPSFITAKFASSEPVRWLSLNKTGNWKSYLGVIVVYLAFLPAMNWLIEWNANLHLPATFSSIETILRNWEDNGANSTETLLDAHGAGEILSGILIIGVLTGFSEEIFFRGSLQKIFLQSSAGKNLSIWIAAFLFSAIHFQFFGFVPRLLMGAFFGYLVVWTGSLWPAVFAHAFNNSLTVITSSLMENVNENNLLETIGTSDGGSQMMALISVVITFLVIFYFRPFFFQSKK